MLLLRDDDVFGVSASWLVDVIAARGGLDGGDGSPVEGTSGIPLGPCDPGSAVVEALERGDRGVDEVAAGEDVGLAVSGGGNFLAVVITTTVIITGLFHWRHFFLMSGATFARLLGLFGLLVVGKIDGIGREPNWGKPLKCGEVLVGLIGALW